MTTPNPDNEQTAIGTTSPWEPTIPTLPKSREAARQLVETLAWPDAPTLAHKGEWGADRWSPHAWEAPRGRQINAGCDGYPDDCPPDADDETFRRCSYCGSIHPQDLARILLDAPTEYPPLPPKPLDAIVAWEREHPDASQEEWRRAYHDASRVYYEAKSARVTLGGADWKYGWPHKFYVEGIPNPAAGQPACVGSESGPVYEADGVTQKRDEQGNYVHYVKPHISPAPATMMAKWYNAHFADLEGATFDFMAALIYERTHILFCRRPDDSDPTHVYYRVPYRGYQA